MNRFLHLLQMALFPFILSGVFAQTGYESTNTDPVLINGKMYVFHPPYGTEGNQFFAGNVFSEGSVMLKGITYSGVQLNYDIYNQLLILKYKGKTGAFNQIIVPDGWLEGFTMEEAAFQLMGQANGKKEIYQVIGSGNIRVLYSWRKKLELSQVHGATNRVFSKPVRTMYLFSNGRLHRYKNNRSFYSFFDPEIKADIRGYLRKNPVNVRKSDDAAISSLLLFINNSRNEK